MSDYRNALLLALSMNQPGRVLRIFENVEKAASKEHGIQSFTGSTAVDEVIRRLSREEIWQLLLNVRNWNATTKNSVTAQRVLHAILKLRTYDDIAPVDGEEHKSKPNPGGKGGQPRFEELLAGMIPYTERHINRLDRLIHESYVIDLVIGEMDSGVMADEMEIDESGRVQR
jgi:U3 small nucleolar RNA-associated protein 13